MDRAQLLLVPGMAIWVEIYNPAGAGRAICPVWRREGFMPTDVIMPQMGESIFEGTITKWLKKAGDSGAERRAAF
jgi:hypothetical protein